MCLVTLSQYTECICYAWGLVHVRIYHIVIWSTESEMGNQFRLCLGKKQFESLDKCWNKCNRMGIVHFIRFDWCSCTQKHNSLHTQIEFYHCNILQSSCSANNANQNKCAHYNETYLVLWWAYFYIATHITHSNDGHMVALQEISSHIKWHWIYCRLGNGFVRLNFFSQTFFSPEQ